MKTKTDVRAKLISTFNTQGYVLLEQRLPPQEAFDSLYGLFDQVSSEEMRQDALKVLKVESREWNRNKKNRRAFADAPMGFNDRMQRQDKADKVYFQFCKEFYFHLRSNCGGIYYGNNLFRMFCDSLMEMAAKAELLIREVIEQLDNGDGRLLSAVRRANGELSILLKVLTYMPSAKWATVPHCDKSALSLIMNADDTEQERLRIPPYRQVLRKGEFTAPVRHNPNKEVGETGIIFPGLCLKAVGFTHLKPSPHGVVPSLTTTPRHSLIGFLFVPNLDTRAMVTDIFPSDQPLLAGGEQLFDLGNVSAGNQEPSFALGKSSYPQQTA